MKDGFLGLKALIRRAFLGVSGRTASAKDNWISLRTRNFNTASNAAEGRSRQVAFKLEQFRHVSYPRPKRVLSSPVTLSLLS